ncbi:hypothetical protein ABT337_17055 [Saccharopolyspora hirsuta]|uniref:Uncharacterized protein n=1 Tax=Saccharopolyspora hirsuta TaxID=1837 RepID=A0A5M7BVQ6_SACHI|nr:hypothetical protein [Saccharopolyspora hirsuta]KAA5833523.1 hypothetical protein F1721_14685 [Saccharopolyspora hirsuta]MBF6507787.1 hypothetical protein [Nocardia farcinica]
MTDERTPSRRERGGPDLVALVGGLITVTVAGTVLFGLGGQLQWLLALTAVTIGVVMLVASLRTRS